MPRTPSVGKRASPRGMSPSPGGALAEQKEHISPGRKNNKLVTVVARCRPLLEGKDSEVGITMAGSTFHVLPVRETGHKGNSFTFDHTYWSIPNTSGIPCASQETIYKDIGRTTLANSMKGYNCTILAYGQTGSGKSYSMFGGEQVTQGKQSRKIRPPRLATTVPSSGIIPRLVNDLYAFIDGHSDVRFTVEVTFYQIYLEKVTCLLSPGKGVLKVREHPLTGPYVEDLTSCLCDSKKNFLKVLEEGNKARRVGSTRQNLVSSRSHAVIGITVTHQSRASNTTTVSKISLVDLAGSERVAKSGLSGVGVIEATTINQSLSILGKIISVLGSKAYKSGTSSSYVPYRDSVLTWLLRESLGGNSRTIMLATISPCASDREETLSTLRYADQAKKIVNKAVVNEGSPRRIIHQLKCEIKFLEEQLYKGADVVLQQKLVQSQKLMEQMSKTWDERWTDTQALLKEKERETKTLQEEKINMGREIKRLAEELKKAQLQKETAVETAKMEAQQVKMEYQRLHDEYAGKCEELMNLTSRTPSLSSAPVLGSSVSSFMSTPPITPRDPLLREVRETAQHLQETFRAGFRTNSPRPMSRPTGTGRGPSPLPRRPPPSPLSHRAVYAQPQVTLPRRSPSPSTCSSSSYDSESCTSDESDASSEIPFRQYKPLRPPVAPLRDTSRSLPDRGRGRERAKEEYEPVPEPVRVGEREQDYMQERGRSTETRGDSVQSTGTAGSFFDRPRPGSPLIAVRQPSPSGRRARQNVEEDERWRKWLETRKNGEKGRPSTPIPMQQGREQPAPVPMNGAGMLGALGVTGRVPVIKHVRQPSPHSMARREDRAAPKYVDPVAVTPSETLEARREREKEKERERERERERTTSPSDDSSDDELQHETDANTREAVRLSEIARKRIDTDYRRTKMGLAPLHKTAPAYSSSSVTVGFNPELVYIQ